VTVLTDEDGVIDQQLFFESLTGIRLRRVCALSLKNHLPQAQAAVVVMEAHPARAKFFQECSPEPLWDLVNLATRDLLVCNDADLGVVLEELFFDLENNPIQALFKLYPWEWMMREKFGPHAAASSTTFIEPMWKVLLSNKAILAVLWEIFPGHPNLLPAYFAANSMSSYAKKPFFSQASRESPDRVIRHANLNQPSLPGSHTALWPKPKAPLSLRNCCGWARAPSVQLLGQSRMAIGKRGVRGLTAQDRPRKTEIAMEHAPAIRRSPHAGYRRSI
jgi:hypothetical protein